MGTPPEPIDAAGPALPTPSLSDAPAGAPPRLRGGGSWVSGWACLLATVFLSGSTLNCLLHWLPFAHPWDLGGMVLSGLLTWLCYAWTISDRTTVPAEKRGVVACGLMVLWALTFPMVLWSLGLK